MTVNITYLVGGFFFSLGGYASILLVVNATRDERRATDERMRWWGYQPQRRDWLSAVVLFVGTLLFAVSLVAAFAEGLTPRQSNGWIWLPDILGCVCFLVSGHLAMLEVGAGHVVVRVHELGWWVVAVNQLGFDPVLPRRDRGLHASGDRQRHRRRTRQLGDVRRRGLLRGGRGHPGFRQANSDKNGGTAHAMTTLSQSAAETLFGNRFLTERAPSTSFPQSGMRPIDAMRLVGEDLNLEGDPQRNLATFVTTWMEPEAQRIIAENLHRNFIDHAEYPISAEIEQRCVRMLADLFNAPGPTTGCRTQGSSEAIMLGALSLKWKWKERREAANLSTDRPNLVFGGDVHVVWEKFCRYFDVEPRIVPLAEDKYTIGPEDVEPHLDENTIGVAAVLGTTFTGHMDDIVGINNLLLDVRNRRDLDIPLHVDGASGGFVWPFLYPDSPWDFRLEQVRSINVSGHKYGLVYPGIGWLIFREESDLAKDLVFYENYLGKTDATFTLNFSTGAAMVLAQYYNFVRLGRDGYTYVMKQMQQNAQALAANLRDSGRFEVIGDDAEQLPLVAFRLSGEHTAYDESDIAWQLSAERGWMVPAYTLPPNAERVKIMRALVKETMSREQVERLTRDIEDACATLDQKGGTTQTEREQTKKGTGY